MSHFIVGAGAGGVTVPNPSRKRIRAAIECRERQLVEARLASTATVAYKRHMIEIRQTLDFQAWRTGLRDLRARAAIARRILRIQAGNFGDVKYIGAGVSELRVDFGPGYRVYLHRRGNIVIVLLCGGDKSAQNADIRRAKALVAELEP